jgi:hypothetical protein
MAYTFVLGIFFEGFFISGFRYAILEVIEVNKINSNKKPGIIPSNLIGGKIKLGFMIGEVNKPDIMKIPNKPINMKVKISKTFVAIFFFLKIIMLVKIIGKIEIKVINTSGIGKLSLVKTSLNTKAKVCAENEHVAIFAIHRKKPIIKAKNPPIPSFPKLYAPPAIGRLVDNSA